MEKSYCHIVCACVVVALIGLPLRGDERDDRIRDLEKRVEQLEKLLQTRDAKATAGGIPKPAESPQPGPTLSIGANGFTMRSADNNFALRIRGLLHVDSRWDLGGDGLDDTFLIRRARPILEGTLFRDFDFQFTPEFGGSSPTIRDAWLNYRYNDTAQLRAGKMKAPGSLERWQSVANIPFIERSFPSLLWSVRDVGVMLHGELWPGEEAVTKTLAAGGMLNYALGIFNGAGDGRAGGNSDFDNGKAGAARLFVHPFLKGSVEPLQRVGIGVSGSYGNTEGDSALPDDFGFRPGVTADGTHWRVGPQAYWYYGPFGLSGEYTISSQELTGGLGATPSIHDQNNAWAITAGWMLTGEDATFRYTTPRNNFDPRAGNWGAWQIVARYTELDLDDDLFPNFADPAELPTRVSSWGIGLNWYLNRNIRTSFNFNHSDFTGGHSGSIADVAENLFATRFQLVF